MRERDGDSLSAMTEVTAELQLYIKEKSWEHMSEC